MSTDEPQVNPSSRGENQTHRWVWLGVLILFVLHQDLWLWAEADLWVGPLPAGLAYHAGYSVVVAFFWLAVVRFAWPTALDDPAPGDSHEAGS